VQEAKKKPQKEKKPRPENKYKKVDCQPSGKSLCDALNVWADAWETWGRTILVEIDEMRLAICNLEKQVYYGASVNQGLICDATGPIVGGGGGPPTDTSQPPKSPFK
jgi:hypothetical protein